jgi:L-lactate dehydrogenase (cytochrome)
MNRDLLSLVAQQLRASVKATPAERRGAKLAALKSVSEIRDAARRRLPKVIFEFVDGAAGDEVTMRRNVAAFDAWCIDPRFLVDVGEVATDVDVLGRSTPTPLLGAPAGLLGLIHRDGEAAMAAAIAHDSSSIYSLAAMSSYTIEEVRDAAPDGRLWFQTYLWKDQGIVDELVARAAAARYEALIVTVDVPRSADRRRDRANGFGLPPSVSPRTLYDGVSRPRWTRDFLLHPRITAGNVAERVDDQGAISVAGYVDRQFDPRATWEDLARLRDRWEGPLIVKGILSAADAERAVRIGAQGVAVSNHGGRQLDHAPSALAVLPEVVQAVGGSAEIYLDGGVRRGSDVIKALALGANACLLGRPFVYGLGVAGREGVAQTYAVLASELRAAMQLSGLPALRQASPAWLRPAG